MVSTPHTLSLSTVMTSSKDCTANAEKLDQSEQSSSATSTDPALVIFPILPFELREHIHHYNLSPKFTSLNPLPPFIGLNLTADLTYNILHLNNEATRVEAGTFYLRSRCFQLLRADESQNFQRCLARFPGSQGYEAVRRLSFLAFSHVTREQVGRHRHGCT
jgi:hypothetical protein